MSKVYVIVQLETLAAIEFGGLVPSDIAVDF